MAQSSTSRGQQGFCGAQPLRAVEAKQVSGSTSQKACGRILMVRFWWLDFPTWDFQMMVGWKIDDGELIHWLMKILMRIFPFWLEDFPTCNPKSSNHHPFWKIDEDWWRLIDGLMDWWRLMKIDWISNHPMEPQIIMHFKDWDFIFSFFEDFFQRKPLVGRCPKMVVAPN